MAVTEYLKKRQRLLNAIEFKPTDRVPFGNISVTASAIKQATGRKDYAEHPNEAFAQAMRIWDVDVVLQFVLDDRLDARTGPMAKVDVWNGLMSIAYQILARWKKEKGAFNTPEDFRDFCNSIPPAEKAKDYFNHENTTRRWMELNTWGEFLKPAVWIPGHLCGTVNWMWYIFGVGYENYLMAHSLYPDSLEHLFSFLGEEGRLINTAIAESIRENDFPPLVYSGEDICGNNGPLVSPQILKELYFPHLKRAVEPLIDAGIHWLWHSDGDIMPVLPALIDCGIDGFQGFEEDKGMDMIALSQTTCSRGGLPFLCGSVSVNSTFYGSPEEVRSDVARMMKLAHSRAGGVIVAPSTSLMKDTPCENVLAFYEACNNQT